MALLTSPLPQGSRWKYLSRIEFAIHVALGGDQPHADQLIAGLREAARQQWTKQVLDESYEQFWTSREGWEGKVPSPERVGEEWLLVWRGTHRGKTADEVRFLAAKATWKDLPEAVREAIGEHPAEG